jgi:diguanylate cyclase (GGDEF)-like protein
MLMLENESHSLQLALEQIGQMSHLIMSRLQQPQRIAGTGSDEIMVLARLHERLEQRSEGQDLFRVFSELVNDLIPVDILAVVHSQFGGGQNSVLTVLRQIHANELEQAFAGLAEQWLRRRSHSPALVFDDARVNGTELVLSDVECTPELRLRGHEIFPIILDNDLFALVLLATSSEALANRRMVQFFSILAHQLLLSVKKELLLAQNNQMQTHDSLTGLYNQRHFYSLLDREFDRARRYNVPLSLLIVDIDHFKDVNEAYGPEAGDLVLQELSRIIIENKRTTDIVSRYSGERFVIVLPETHNRNAELMANRIRRYVENNSFFIPNSSVFIKVTASVGVASYLEHKPASTAQFVEIADSALYFAKLNGRNQVVNYSYVLNMMLGTTPNQG